MFIDFPLLQRLRGRTSLLPCMYFTCRVLSAMPLSSTRCFDKNFVRVSYSFRVSYMPHIFPNLLTILKSEAYEYFRYTFLPISCDVGTNPVVLITLGETRGHAYVSFKRVLVK